MMMNIQSLFEWIDLLWVPVALLCLHKGQRLKGAVFVLACAFIMRLQIQLMEEIGFGNGFLGLLDTPLYARGLVTYSLTILIFFLLSYYSPNIDKFVHVAASITIFTGAFCVFFAVMAL
ncbi:MAG: hypothetical protein H6853_01895 [Rhodospirillales bacterium]|nr:MAG: hypothetical protein H6853_01895 [Rhodospirillales bacterium]